MPISRKRLDEIAKEVATQINEDGYGYIFKQDAEAFALALVRRLEAEIEVVPQYTNAGNFIPSNLAELPLVDSD